MGERVSVQSARMTRDAARRGVLAGAEWHISPETLGLIYSEMGDGALDALRDRLDEIRLYRGLPVVVGCDFEGIQLRTNEGPPAHQ